MSTRLKAFLIIFSGIFIALSIVIWKINHSDTNDLNKFSSHINTYIKYFSLAEVKDKKYRLKISTAYCTSLYQQRKLSLSELEECGEKYITRTAELYKILTNEELGSLWENLSNSEKALAVKNVEEKSKILNAVNQINNQLEYFLKYE